ncbi:TPA: DUF2787 domain-containing protein [Vibrio parahaemolyticus]|nr:DUF2787 domain-containing protein [Vibrio parahaemolyticus]
MKMIFTTEKLLLPVTTDLQGKLVQIANQHHLPMSSTRALTYNFKDTSYSAESGGWHPVEIRIEQDNGQWHFCYITDFSYVGYPYPELAKEVDFDFANGEAAFLYMPPQSISDTNVIDFYQMWELNFMTYLHMDVYDEITITID